MVREHEDGGVVRRGSSHPTNRASPHPRTGPGTGEHGAPHNVGTRGKNSLKRCGVGLRFFELPTVPE